MQSAAGIRLAIDAASSRASRVALVGSMISIFIMLPYFFGCRVVAEISTAACDRLDSDIGLTARRLCAMRAWIVSLSSVPPLIVVLSLPIQRVAPGPGFHRHASLPPKCRSLPGSMRMASMPLIPV